MGVAGPRGVRVRPEVAARMLYRDGALRVIEVKLQAWCFPGLVVACFAAGGKVRAPVGRRGIRN